MRVVVDGAVVELADPDWIGEGGEGRVYAKRGVAYKLYADVSRAVPHGKLTELAAIASPRVIRPERLVFDEQGARIGHTMRYLPDAVPLCRLFTRSFRERAGFDDAQLPGLVAGLADTVRAVHAARVVVVDLHESNALLDASLSAVHLIDADSFATPSCAATAQLDAIRDRHATTLDARSDWFAFAILAFQLFIGIHPYRGTHPVHKDLDARMSSDTSAFDPDVKLPSVCFPLSSIPPLWRGWLEAVLQQRHRGPPPDARSAPPFLFDPDDGLEATCGAEGTEDVQALPFARLPETVLSVHDLGARLVVATTRGVYVDGRRALDGRFRAIGQSPRGTLVAARIDGRTLSLVSPFGPIATSLAADDVTSIDGRLIVRSGDRLVELALVDVGQRVVASPLVVGFTMPATTQLWPGCAVEQVAGKAWLTLFPRSGMRERVRVPTLDGRTVVGASADRGVFVAVFANRDRYDRVVLRLDKRGDVDLRVDADVEPSEPDLTVLDTGVAVLRVDAQRLAAFGAGSAVRVLHAPEGRLFRSGATLLAVRGRNVQRLVTKR